MTSQQVDVLASPHAWPRIWLAFRGDWGSGGTGGRPAAAGRGAPTAGPVPSQRHRPADHHGNHAASMRRFRTAERPGCRKFVDWMAHPSTLPAQMRHPARTPGGLEGQAELVDEAHVGAVYVADLQLPGAVGDLGGGVDGVGGDDVVGAVGGVAVLQPVQAAVGCHQVDHQVTAVGVLDVDPDLQVARRVTGHPGDRDGAVHGGAGGIRDVDVGEVLEVGAGWRWGAAAGQADHPRRAVGVAEQQQNGRAVAAGLGRDDLVGRVEAAAGRTRRVHLEGVAPDPLVAPQPVVDRPVGDVQVGGLLGGVAVGGGHLLPEGGEGVALLLGHAGRGVVEGVAERPEHQLAVGVEVDPGGDLLRAADDPAAHEVGDHAHLGRRLAEGAAVGLAARAAGGAAAAAPVVVPVAVQVGADVGRAGVRLPVLAPGPVRAGGDVVLAAVGVQVGQDPDLARVDQIGDLGVGAVATGEQVHQVEGHLDGEVLAGVLVVGEQHLGLVLVGSDVVGDLDRVDRPALVRGADRGAADQRRVGAGQLVDRGHHLRVVVVPGVGRREVVDAHLALGRRLALRGVRPNLVTEPPDLADLVGRRGDVQLAVLGRVQRGTGRRYLGTFLGVPHPAHHVVG